MIRYGMIAPYPTPNHSLTRLFFGIFLKLQTYQKNHFDAKLSGNASLDQTSFRQFFFILKTKKIKSDKRRTNIPPKLEQILIKPSEKEEVQYRALVEIQCEKKLIIASERGKVF